MLINCYTNTKQLTLKCLVQKKEKEKTMMSTLASTTGLVFGVCLTFHSVAFIWFIIHLNHFIILNAKIQQFETSMSLITIILCINKI